MTESFQTKWGIPKYVGAIDGYHIPIAAPTGNHTDYYNRKGFYSMPLQGVVDADYRFLDICIGWPGNVYDVHVLVHSPIYTRITEEDLLPNKPMSIDGVNVPSFLIGDSAYPLQMWLMKPFSQSGVLTTEMKQYNYRLSRAHIVVENAYGRLKARWRRLMKRNDIHINHIPNVVAVACILHTSVKFMGSTSMIPDCRTVETVICLNLQLLPLEIAPATNRNM